MKGDLYFFLHRTLCGLGSSIVVFHEKRGGVCNLSLFLGMSPVEDERKVDSNSSDVMHSDHQEERAAHSVKILRQ